MTVSGDVIWSRTDPSRFCRFDNSLAELESGADGIFALGFIEASRCVWCGVFEKDGVQPVSRRGQFGRVRFRRLCDNTFIEPPLYSYGSCTSYFPFLAQNGVYVMVVSIG